MNKIINEKVSKVSDESETTVNEEINKTVNETNETIDEDAIINEEEKAKFIAILRATANVSHATYSAGISRRGAYRLKLNDKKFEENWNDAINESADKLELEARRRAIGGVQKPIMYKGQTVAFTKIYSDRLLEFLLKAYKPEMFRERISNEISGPNGGPIQIQEGTATQKLKTFLNQYSNNNQSNQNQNQNQNQTNNSNNSNNSNDDNNDNDDNNQNNQNQSSHTDTKNNDESSRTTQKSAGN